jgi:hypothetical protein
MRVHILASDLDGKPLKNESSAIKVHFSGQSVPSRWEQASGELVADISEDLTASPGDYEISVEMTVWTFTVETGDRNSTCILLRKGVTVVEAQRVALWVLIASLILCTILILMLVIWAKRKADDLKEILTMVMTETVKLVLSIVFDIGNLITDLMTAYKIVFADDVVMGTRWKILYAVFGCLSIIVGVFLILHRGQHLIGVRRRLTLQLNERDRVYTTADDEMLQRLTWEEKKILRDMQMNASSLLCLVFEDIPMIAVTCALVLSEDVTDKLVSATLMLPALGPRCPD